MKRILLVCFTMLLATSLFGTSNKRHIEESAGYSLVIPNRWQYTDVFGTKNRSMFWRKEEFAPRILFFDESYNGPLAPYVDSSIESLKKDITQFRMGENKSFVTESGLNGIKFAFSGTLSGKRIRMVCYLFKKPNNQTFLVIGQCLAKNKRIEMTFDKCISTLQFE